MRGSRQAERSTGAATSSLLVDRGYQFGRPTAGALALVAMLLLSGTVMAVSPWVAQGAVIHACYNPAKGALRRVASGHCRRGEAQISWNLAGPAGQKGPVGPPGFQGVQGVAGATGPAGQAGAPGSPAIQGQTGATGEEVPGAIGARGQPGAPGEASTEKGPTGTAGDLGANGATGPMGPTGEHEGGATGPTGPTGPGLPGTLASGKSETGMWIVTTPHVTALSPFLSGTEIAFQVPLAEKLVNTPVNCATVPSQAGCHAKQINLKETSELIAGTKGVIGCKATPAADPKLLEEPPAESGNLCAYTGAEVLGEPVPPVRAGLSNDLGESGASPGGASIGYLNEEIETEGLVTAQGSWAVRG